MFAPTLLLAIASAACSQSMNYTTFNPNDVVKLNPHPLQRYEVIVKVDAPGPFDSVKGRVVYGISNESCVPKNTFEGATEVPDQSYYSSFPLERVDETTYKGYFYRDQLLGANYFGLGECHWDVSSLGADLTVHGLTFDAGTIPFGTLPNGTRVLVQPVRSGFRKQDYFDKKLNNHNLTGTYDPNITASAIDVDPASKGAFVITVTVKEASHGSDR